MRVRLPCNPASPGLAREFVLGALEREGEANELGDIVTLLVSELVTNAYLHANSEVEVKVRCWDGAVSVAVSDKSPRPPRIVKTPTDRPATGRGLQLVEALADHWGSELADNGKTVWFSLERNGSSNN